MNSNSLKVVSLSVLTTFLLAFSGCGSSSGCCPDQKKVEDSVQNLETLAVATEEPAEVEAKKNEDPAPAPIVIANTPPTSIINGITSPNGLLGSTLLVNGSSSKDDVGVTSYKWTVNKEIISTTDKAKIALEQPGTYNICLDVTDADHVTDQTCQTVIVAEPEAEVVNTPPISVISGIVSKQGKVGDILSVDGSLSSDDVNIIAYKWSVNGGVVSTAPTTNITLDKPGTYNICLDVTDSDNVTDQTCKVVTIPEPKVILSNPPKAVILGIIDNEQRAPGSIVLNGTTSSDDIGIVSYQWSINDINVSTEATPTVELITADKKICLTVTDADNQTDQTCKNITIVAPSIPKAVASGIDGATIKTQCPIIVSAAGSSAEGATISSYQWLLDGAEVATTQDINISIATEGTHKLCLIVTDSMGQTSEENCQDITINPHVAPTPTLTLIDSANQPVTNKTLLPNTQYSLSCAGSIDDCDREVASCEWNASSYLVAADGTKIPYIEDCFGSQHAGHGDKITTTSLPSNIKLCGNTSKFNQVVVTLTVTDVLGNTQTVTEEYTVNP